MTPAAILRHAVLQSAREPEWFFRQVLQNTQYDDWQLELCEAVADVDRIQRGEPTRYNHGGLTRFTVRSCHGTGKTTALGLVLHWYQFTRRARVPVTAPKLQTVTTRIWPAFRGLLGQAIPGYQQLIDAQATRIVWGGNPSWCAMAETATKPENLAGHHPTVDVPHLLFAVEEASGVEDHLFPVIEGALSTEGALLLLISNPTRTTGEFYRSHCTPGTMENYYRMHIPPERSRFVSPAWVASMARKYGRESPVFKIRCLGEFSDLTPNQLFAMDWIEAAIGPRPAGDGSAPRLRVSVDVADGGVDESVVTAGVHWDSHVAIVRQRRYSFEPAVAAIKTAEAARDMFHALGGNKDADDFVVDALGVGAGTAGILMKWGYRVIPYRGGESSDDSSQWRNRRVQTHIAARNAFRDRTITLCDDMYADQLDWEDLRGQLTSIRTAAGGGRVEDLETKKDMAARNVKSPDMAESLVMQYATQTPTLAPADWVDSGMQHVAAAPSSIPGGGGDW